MDLYIQWNPVNTDTNGTCPSVRIKRVVRKNVTNTCFIEEKTMEIPCVYNFDGPSKHVNLLQQLIDVGNNPAVRTEVDADSGKQRRPKGKKDSSNDGSKRKKK